MRFGDWIGKELLALTKATTALVLASGLLVLIWWYFRILRGPVRVEVTEWSVPDEFAKAGISGQAAARFVMDEARKLQRLGFQGQDPHIGFQFQKLPGDVDPEVLGIKIRFLYPILVIISGRLLQVGGVVAKQEKGYRLTVWAKTPLGNPKNITKQTEGESRDDVFRLAGELVVLMVDPVALVLTFRQNGAGREDEILAYLRQAVRRDFPVRLGPATALAELGELTKDQGLCDEAVKKARKGRGRFSFFFISVRAAFFFRTACSAFSGIVVCPSGSDGWVR